jgi:5-methylcytosine-specific restriction endonuclease McrA
MSITTLLLTPWMSPTRVISWQRAIVLTFLGKVEVVEEYEAVVVSPSTTLRIPAVVRQRRAAPHRARSPAFSRSNVFLRDDYTCQYCTETKEPSLLNLDHVLPRSQGGRSGWENIVTSCYPCNQRKAGRTPEQASMRLLRRPVRPARLAKPRLATLRAGKTLPTEWEPYWR